VEDETDELLLADDELFDVDPEALPRSLLSDFSVYNSEVSLLNRPPLTPTHPRPHPFSTHRHLLSASKRAYQMSHRYWETGRCPIS